MNKSTYSASHKVLSAIDSRAACGLHGCLVCDASNMLFPFLTGVMGVVFTAAWMAVIG